MAEIYDIFTGNQIYPQPELSQSDIERNIRTEELLVIMETYDLPAFEASKLLVTE